MFIANYLYLTACLGVGPASLDARGMGATLGDRRQFAADDQSGVIAVSNPADLVFSRFAYGDHGEPSQQSGSAFMYTGQRIIPGTGLYHYKARTYLFAYFSWHVEYAIAAKHNPN